MLFQHVRLYYDAMVNIYSFQYNQPADPVTKHYNKRDYSC